jgi:hypothetical protein
MSQNVLTVTNFADIVIKIEAYNFTQYFGHIWVHCVQSEDIDGTELVIATENAQRKTTV